MDIIWSRRAQGHLDAIVAYIARDNADAADRMADRILSATAHLSTHPAMGRPGRIDGTRELVIPGTPYIVPYRVRHNRVSIIAVLHSAREWPRSL